MVYSWTIHGYEFQESRVIRQPNIPTVQYSDTCTIFVFIASIRVSGRAIISASAMG